MAERDLDEAIIIALGGNMDFENQSVEITTTRALQRLEENGVKLVGRSSFWRSAAWPDPSQQEYRNAVCLVETGLRPGRLLTLLHEIERQFGRLRAQGEAINAARTLDLDLIAYGRKVQVGPPALPHPRAAQRLFVMGPLAEIAPDWLFPGLDQTAKSLAASAPVGRDAAPL